MEIISLIITIAILIFVIAAVISIIFISLAGVLEFLGEIQDNIYYALVAIFKNVKSARVFVRKVK